MKLAFIFLLACGIALSYGKCYFDIEILLTVYAPMNAHSIINIRLSNKRPTLINAPLKRKKQRNAASLINAPL